MTPDGIFLTSASKDGQPQLRNGESGDWIGTFQGHKGAVWACVLNDAAFVAATASADFSARVWNAVTGDEVHAFAHKHIVRTAAFERGQGGTRLVTGGAEKLVRVFDLERPEVAPVEFGKFEDAIRRCTWALDNKSLLITYLDRPGIDVLDLSTGSVVKTIEGSANSTGPIMSVDFTNDGEYLVTAEEHMVTLRKATGGYDAVKQHSITDYQVEAAAYSPQMKKIVAGGSDMWVHVYDHESGSLLENCKGHHGPIHCLKFAPHDKTFASGSEDGTIRLWKAEV